MQSYVYKLSGQFEQVEKSARNLDKAFRTLYNVHGTNRITSWFDKETGTYNVQPGGIAAGHGLMTCVTSCTSGTAGIVGRGWKM